LATEQGKQDVTAWLIDEWTSKFASSVETMTERRPPVTAGSRIPLSAPEAPQEALWHSIPLTLASEAAFFIGATTESWLHIGKSALVAAGIPDSSDADARGTFLEILTQATSAAVQSLAERLEKSIICLPAKEVTRAELNVPAGLIPVEISLSEPPVGRVYLGWSQALEQQLSASKAADPAAAAAPDAKVTRQPPPEKSGTLDLLMEVELPVSVSFGRADLPLRDVLKLNSGSIVELNRTISDPVEIIVNNCVIARGEVVVVDGNYGVRIQQVVSREERLRTLK
jgi:flagellar motor switch protein FliN/FliY